MVELLLDAGSDINAVDHVRRYCFFIIIIIIIIFIIVFFFLHFFHHTHTHTHTHTHRMAGRRSLRPCKTAMPALWSDSLLQARASILLIWCAANTTYSLFYIYFYVLLGGRPRAASGCARRTHGNAEAADGRRREHQCRAQCTCCLSCFIFFF